MYVCFFGAVTLRYKLASDLEVATCSLIPRAVRRETLGTRLSEQRVDRRQQA